MGTDAPNNGTPSWEWENTPNTVIVESDVSNESPKQSPEKWEEWDDDKELTDEELKSEIERLKGEVEKEQDPKEKRHKEQDIGWKMKLQKERDKAKALENANKQNEERAKKLENSLIEEAYNKAIDESYWLSYFENLTKTNPDFAEKVSQSKWGKSAKTLIWESKRELADKNNDEDLKKQISEEDIRQSEREKIYHEISIQQAEDLFSTLSQEEQIQAKEYFNDIVEGKKLTPEKAKKYAEMAKVYVAKDKKVEPTKVDKDKLMATQASTKIAQNSWGWSATQKDTIDIQAMRQSLLSAWIDEYQVNLMYPLN